MVWIRVFVWFMGLCVLSIRAWLCKDFWVAVWIVDLGGYCCAGLIWWVLGLGVFVAGLGLVILLCSLL